MGSLPPAFNSICHDLYQQNVAICSLIDMVGTGVVKPSLRTTMGHN
jgi:hypothetical protein